jgi:hypothetical protein
MTLAPDSHGLTLLPFFAAETGPDWASKPRIYDIQAESMHFAR